MSSDDDEHPPKEPLQPVSHFQKSQNSAKSSVMANQDSTNPRQPYQIKFSSREEEIRYTNKLKENCATYNGDPELLSNWLRETGAYIAQESIPETDHPFLIRHLLNDDALDFYLAHEDIIFNFYDLRKLLLHKYNLLTPLRMLSSLDSIPSSGFNSNPLIATSTQLQGVSMSNMLYPTGSTTFSLSQTLDDLTQHDIRKTIIEDLHRNYVKFTGDSKQDVVKWLKVLNNKFETAGIPDGKKFDLISQLLDKGAFDWFEENKPKFNHSWVDFVEHFKKTFDSPNRSRIAMQKLTAYAQSPNQDVRSFCREMRRLFQEADPQMSSLMKLELLLAKVKPSYRLDLLKQKPKDAEEFETMATDLENTYLVFEAIEQNLPSTPSLSSATSTPVASDRRAPPSYPTRRNNDYYPRTPYSGPRFPLSARPLLRNYTPNSPNWQSSASWRPWRPRPPYRPSPAPYVPYNNSAALSAISSPMIQPVQQQPPVLSSDTPSLVPSSVPQQPPRTQPSPHSVSSVCEKCGVLEHSVSDCPF